MNFGTFHFERTYTQNEFSSLILANISPARCAAKSHISSLKPNQITLLENRKRKNQMIIRHGTSNMDIDALCVRMSVWECVKIILRCVHIAPQMPESQLTRNLEASNLGHLSPCQIFVATDFKYLIISAWLLGFVFLLFVVDKQRH